MYIWQRKPWPTLTWNDSTLSPLLACASREQGRLPERMDDVGPWDRAAYYDVHERTQKGSTDVTDWLT